MYFSHNMLKATSESVFLSLRILNMAGLQFNTRCTTKTICMLDIRIDIESLTILFPQYTDEAMTLVHITGPSVTPDKYDGQFLLKCQYQGGTILAI